MRRAKGAGTIVRIKGKWLARKRMDGTSVYGPPRDTRDEAERDRLTIEIGKPRPKDNDPLLADWAADCRDSAWGRNMAPTSFDQAEGIRCRYVQPHAIAKMRLSKIRRQHVQAWVDELKGSPPYVHRIAAYLSKLMSMAQDDGLVKENPCRRMRLPKMTPRENRVLSPAEALPLLNPQNRTDTFMLFALLTGARRSEIAGLKWADVDSLKGLLRIRGTKTRKAVRTVPMPTQLADALNALDRHGEYVFSTTTGKALGTRNISRDVSARMRGLGLPPETRLHDLRGSFISLLLEQGADVRTVMELVGHADARTTLQVYARSRNDVKKAAVNKLAEMITDLSGLANRVIDEQKKA